MRRFGDTALLVLVALGPEPRSVVRLLDEVRGLDARVGPGTLYGAIARLESLGLIEPTINGGGRPAYRQPAQRALTAASGLTGGARA